MPPLSKITLSFAVFVSPTKQLAMIDLADPLAERASSNAVAAGWQFVGSLGITNGEPFVSIEKGREAIMAAAGAEFAALLGPKLKERQLTEGAI